MRIPQVSVQLLFNQLGLDPVPQLFEVTGLKWENVAEKPAGIYIYIYVIRTHTQTHTHRHTHTHTHTHIHMYTYTYMYIFIHTYTHTHTHTHTHKHTHTQIGAKELTNPHLARALRLKTEFTLEEWDKFGISGLTVDDFIKSVY